MSPVRSAFKSATLDSLISSVLPRYTLRRYTPSQRDPDRLDACDAVMDGAHLLARGDSPLVTLIRRTTLMAED